MLLDDVNATGAVWSLAGLLSIFVAALQGDGRRADAADASLGAGPDIDGPQILLVGIHVQWQPRERRCCERGDDDRIL